MSVAEKTEMSVCVYVCGLGASQSPCKVAVERVCHINTQIGVFFSTDMRGASLEQGLCKALLNSYTEGGAS